MSTSLRLRRIAIVACLLALLPALASYAGAMLEPSNTSLGIRSVEWLRDHGAAGMVSQVETLYYQLTAPSKGGPALHALPSVGRGTLAGTSATTGASGSTGTGASTGGSTGTSGSARPGGSQAATYVPPPIAPLTRPALPGEGLWHPARLQAGPNPPLLLSTFRSAPSEYPRLVAGVAWIDTARTRIVLYPGRREPSVPLSRGPMEVPQRVRGRLLATFNSGFKLTDAHGGFAVRGHTYVHLRDGRATVVGYRDGRVDVVSWSGGPVAPANVRFARQNLPLIVEEGRPSPNLRDGPSWGVTVGNAVLVWRSGLGVDRHGNLIYAAADNQSVRSLAEILIHAGAVRAMQLDINSYWVSFISYGAPGALEPTNLLSGMERPTTRYLSPDDRDFFAVYER